MSPDTCAAILEKAGLDNWALGKTKVMFSCNFQGKKEKQNPTEFIMIFNSFLTIFGGNKTEKIKNILDSYVPPFRG